MGGALRPQRAAPRDGARGRERGRGVWRPGEAGREGGGEQRLEGVVSCRGRGGRMGSGMWGDEVKENGAKERDGWLITSYITRLHMLRMYVWQQISA